MFRLIYLLHSYCENGLRWLTCFFFLFIAFTRSNGRRFKALDHGTRWALVMLINAGYLRAKTNQSYYRNKTFNQMKKVNSKEQIFYTFVWSTCVRQQFFVPLRYQRGFIPFVSRGDSRIDERVRKERKKGQEKRKRNEKHRTGITKRNSGH